MRLSLTRRSEYGVRVLVHLAGANHGRRVTAAELAEACDIPPGNVPTIMNLLSRAGILHCTPGRGGGCRLARDPADLSMLEIVESLEGRLELSHCILDSRRCDDHNPECAVHPAWSRGRRAAVESLAGITLADTARRQQEIERIVADRRLPRVGTERAGG